MLRITVAMHNVADEDIYRPHAWSAFDTKDLESADYRACAAYGPLYKKDENKKFRPGDRAEFFMASQSFLIFQSRSPRINGIAERSELSATGRVYSMNRSVIRFEYLPSSLGIPPFAIKSLSAAVSEDENLTTA